METLLAEKVETILRRSIANTRFKDFYDVHLLFNMQNIDKELFRQAIIATSIHRHSEDSLKNAKSTIKEIASDDSMQMQWKAYTRKYPFAKGIEFNDILQTIQYMIEDINL